MTATDTYLLLRAFCDELARCGMTHACTSPGSRNTPLVLSLVREPGIRCWSHLDERCAGFFALGAAKASARPVAVTCTSGTAAANLAPAVVEAAYARVPLLVLTADRPADLREVGAGQAIDQIKLYGDAPKWFFEVETAGAEVPILRWMRQLACRAYWTALEDVPGPVHLNFPLREPLVLDAPLPPDPVPGRPGRRPWVARERPASRSPTARRSLPARTVIVAGRDERGAGLGAQAAALAARGGFPVLADPLSGARQGQTAIARYDLLLRDPGFAQRVIPDLVVRVGDLPTSKPLRAWLQSLTEVDQLALDPERAWQDPAASVTEIETADPGAVLDGCDPATPADSAWMSAWSEADRAASAAIAPELGGQLSEPLVAARLGEWLGPEVTLLVAASMPIRDVELYLPAGRELPRVVANRGANGIDGTVSTAFGLAADAARGHPVVALVGDVALAHDMGGLIAAKRLGLGLTIVLLNNDGGGIFHFLAVSEEADAFEEHVATPHGLDFERAAALYELGYARPQTEAELRAEIERAVGSGTTTIIEVRTERVGNLALHRRLAAAGLAAIS